MSYGIEEIVNELEEVTRRTRGLFGNLSTEQLNWKPTTGSWSIAQCLDHLITINQLYFPLLQSMRTGRVTPTFAERYSPMSGFFGKVLIRTLSPEYSKKTETSQKAEPWMSEIDRGIIDRFAEHQATLMEHLQRMPPSLDRSRTVITSPLLRWVTYSLDDCLTILAVHEKRHLLQAKRVMEADTFPRSA